MFCLRFMLFPFTKFPFKLLYLFNVYFVFFMLDLFPTFKTNVNYFGNIEKCPFTNWWNMRWFLQIVDIGNFNMKWSGRWFPQILDIATVGIYIQYIYKKIVVLVSELVGGRYRVTELPCSIKYSQLKIQWLSFDCPMLSNARSYKINWRVRYDLPYLFHSTLTIRLTFMRCNEILHSFET